MATTIPYAAKMNIYFLKKPWVVKFSSILSKLEVFSVKRIELLLLFACDLR